MKKIFVVVILAAVSAAAYLAYPFALRTFFLVKGTVEITADLAEKAAKPNMMLFLVAKNENGVPVAVKKIINPILPLDFQMTPSDLIMPDVLTKKIYLEAYLNAHGQLGVLKSGDLTGSIKRPIYVFAKRDLLIIDTAVK